MRAIHMSVHIASVHRATVTIRVLRYSSSSYDYYYYYYYYQVLHVNDNFLPTLPLEFDRLNKLHDLRLHNNPLRTPPMDVCVSGVMQPIGRFIRRAVERDGKRTVKVIHAPIP